MPKPEPDFSKIPSIQTVDRYLKEQGLHYGKEKRQQVNDILNHIRNDRQLLADPNTTQKEILERLTSRLDSTPDGTIPLINGTGTVIHTNLGRSVFSRELLASVSDIATSYTNLEFSLKTGKRGARLDNVADLLKTLTGAEEAVVVNNNAAAVLLTLTSLAADREVVVSRGELIEIGGSFRIPEVIESSGAELVEVGTTNRTRIEDYGRAICERTAVLLKAHMSNYRIVGFTQSVGTAELKKLCRKHGPILVEDIGSGALAEFAYPQLNGDPLISSVLREGADIVTVSGDKLIGGPQSGIILGKRHYLDRIRRHPLYRALRCGKLTMLLLEKTLLAYARNRHTRLVPTQGMLNESESSVRKRMERIAKDVRSDCLEPVKCRSTPGGGSLPGKTMPSWGLRLEKRGWSENRILQHLRSAHPPVVGRVQNGNAILDCRTILEHQIPDLQRILTDFSSLDASPQNGQERE